MAHGERYRLLSEGDGQPILGQLNTRSLRVFQGLDGLEALAEDWQSITDSMPKKECFHSVDWYRCYLTCLAKIPDNALFFAIYEHGELIAIFPFFRSTQNFGLIRNHVLGLPDHPHVPFGDLVIVPDADAASCIAILLEELCGQKKFAWDCIVLPRVFEHCSTAAVSQVSLPRGMKLISHSAEACDYLPVKPYDVIFKDLTSGTRSNLRRARKRSQQLDDLRYSCITTFPEMEKAFGEFLELEGSGWKGASGSGTAIQLDPQLVSFYRSLLERFSPWGECVIHMLRDGDRPICAALGLASNGIYYGLKLGYDEEFKMLSPGNLLQEYVLQHYEESGEVNCLNLVSHTSWQRCWKPQQYQASELTLFNRTLRGRVLSRLEKLRNRLRALKHKCRERFFESGRGKLSFRGFRKTAKGK